MKARLLLSVAGFATLAVFAAPACTERACTSIYISHSIEMSRELEVPASGLSSLRFRMCLATTCGEASPAADGRMELPYLGSNAPVAASVTTDGATNKARIVVTFNVGAGSAAPLRITVTDATGGTVHESSATVAWNDDDCHPEPLSTKL